jgi:hypothetical protein
MFASSLFSISVILKKPSTHKNGLSPEDFSLYVLGALCGKSRDFILFLFVVPVLPHG